MSGLPRALLFVLPVATFAFGWAIFEEMRPIYNGIGPYDYDPAYIYLFNGLNILKFATPGHVDHPGTPLQVLSGLIILAKWSTMHLFGLTNLGLTQSVLNSPEDYIAPVCFVLLLLNSLAVWFLGHRLFVATKSLLLALISQTTPFLFEILAPRLVHLSPEALMFGVTTLLLAVLVPEIFRTSNQDRSNGTTSAVLAGILCGVGLAVKITFLPVLSLLLVLRPARRFRYAVIALVIGLEVSLIPIFPAIAETLAWLLRAATHTGHYGTGEVGFVELGRVPQNLAILWSAFPLAFVSVIALALAFVCLAPRGKLSLTQRPQLPYRTVSAVFLLAIIGQTAMVLKHFGIHYFIPTLPVALVGLSYLLWVVADCNRFRPIGRMLPALGLAVLIGHGSFLAVTNLEKFRAWRQASNLEHADISYELAKHPNAIVISTYRVWTQSFATMFGLTWTRKAHKETAQEILSDVFYYNKWRKKFADPVTGNWVEPSYINSLIATDKPVLLLAPKNLDRSDFSLELLLETERQNIFRVNRILQ